MGNNSDSDMDNILDDLLSSDCAEDNKPKTLKELNFNFLDSVSVCKSDNKTIDNECISEILVDQLISTDNNEEESSSQRERNFDSTQSVTRFWKNSNKNVRSKNVNSVRPNTAVTTDIYTDPFFGLKVVNPLISSAELSERMKGKTVVSISKVKTHTNFDTTDDWVIAGILIDASPPKTSQKGSSYCIWKVTDLSENMNTITIFLFSDAYKSFWKTIVGTAVSILNPSVLNSKDNTNEITLSVNRPQKIMIIGKSKDMGKCKSVKKNGEPCTSIVNLSRCEYCVYHVKQEYKKYSRRADLLSNNNVRGFSSDLSKNKMQKRIHKFNDNAQPFIPIRSKWSEKLYEQDQKRLSLLSKTISNDISGTEVKNNSDTVKLNSNRMQEGTAKINGSISLNNDKQTKQGQLSSIVARPMLNRISNANVSRKGNQEKRDLTPADSLIVQPRLGMGCNNSEIDFSQPISKRQIDIAKRNAIRWVKDNGPFKTENRNRVHSRKIKATGGSKRLREGEESEKVEEQDKKKSNSLMKNFKEIMNTQSTHADLIEKSHQETEEKYFNKLEVKEKMEEKMLSTFQIQCKAVRCLTCKYLAFSGSEFCKERGHPLCVIDAIKRFFKCGDCGNRTVCLDKLPSHSCTKCNSSKWMRAAMMDDRKTKINSTNLSVRGDEEKFIGSTSADVNLNLLVSED